MPPVQDPDRSERAAAPVACPCGQGLSAADEVGSAWAQVWDIAPVELEKVHWVLPRRRCGCCAKTSTAVVPSAQPGAVVYGPNVNAAAVLLASQGNVPVERAAGLMAPAVKRKCCAVGACCAGLPAPRTVKGIRAVLRSALSQAQVEELVSRNVAALVKLPPIRKRKGNAWSSDEARTFLESSRVGADYLYAAYVLVLVLGLRKGEVLGLTWDHLDWAGWDKPCDEHGTEFCEPCRDRYDIGLRVDKQLQRVRGRLLHRETKTEESDAPLPLPAICVTALRERRLRQWEAANSAGDLWHATTMVFTSRYGLPVEPRNFNRSYDARIVKAGVRRITVHDARRTCASLLVDLDVHPRVAMAILRHADFSITMEVYSQVSSEATRAALKRLGDSLVTS